MLGLVTVDIFVLEVPNFLHDILIVGLKSDVHGVHVISAAQGFSTSTFKHVSRIEMPPDDARNFIQRNHSHWLTRHALALLFTFVNEKGKLGERDEPLHYFVIFLLIEVHALLQDNFLRAIKCWREVLETVDEWLGDFRLFRFKFFTVVSWSSHFD